MAKENKYVRIPLHILARNVTPRNVVREKIESNLDLILDAKYTHLLYVWGEGGIGKTFTVKQILKERGIPYVLANDPTPLGIFMAGMKISNEHGFGVLIIDEGQFAQRDLPQLYAVLNQMTDSYEVRTVQRITKTGQQRGVKESYEFRGKVVLISNEEMPVGSATANALLDRAIIVEATPNTVEEAIMQIKYTATTLFPEHGEKVAEAYFLIADAILEELSVPRGSNLLAILLSPRTFVRSAEMLPRNTLHAIRIIKNAIVNKTQVFHAIANSTTYREAKEMYPLLTRRTYYRYRAILMGGRKTAPIENVVLEKIKPKIEKVVKDVAKN